MKPVEPLGRIDDDINLTIAQLYAKVDQLIKAYNALLEAYETHEHGYTIGYNSDVQRRTTDAPEPQS